MNAPFDRIFICYVPGLDLRRVDDSTCPWVSQLLERFPSATFRTLGTSDSLPTLLTGAYPQEHELWGPRLKQAAIENSFSTRLVDSLPDLLTTTFQCFLHVVSEPMDLAGIPPRRRRRFEMKFFKHIKTRDIDNVTGPINGIPSLFSVIGSQKSRFIYLGRLSGLHGWLPRLAEENHAIEMVEIHCLDQLQHWMSDQEERILDAYRVVDDLVARLQEKCRLSGRAFLFLCDHGTEPVKGAVDVVRGLRSLDVPADEYDYFIENTRARFWLHTPRSRKKITDLLESLPHSQVLDWKDLARFGVRFENADFGDVYLYLEPGYIIFPNDFEHPLASRVLALVDWQQRPRFWNPRHRSDHGYLPDAESERGFMILADREFAVSSEEVHMVDFAPSVLALLGEKAADTMPGKAIFRHRSLT